ncbi:hypothetical protein GJ654_14180 [Rhodoblastus acidophilus]|jgi:hypothetical protein|uniref:Uncharacterized protein n=1 Tax=Rhodoblastus acidophilus TaxID=1074 RepID=A0A6N8DTG9_RHOAC|nr:hypothetical protein [Rhodoblastus acidophilus]MCW2275637.1 hypothetical protein [Rhodoblastus acidophilus]MTV32134.1 hypothetical protein [Rhodoblastus acidophilus]
MTEGGPSLRVRAARSIAFGAGFAVVAALALLVAFACLAGAAYLALLDSMQPRLAALCVAGGSLLVALAAGLTGRALIGGGVERMTTAVRTSAVVALAPQALRFGLRNAKLIGLASTAAATYFALRSARRTD